MPRVAVVGGGGLVPAEQVDEEPLDVLTAGLRQAAAAMSLAVAAEVGGELADGLQVGLHGAGRFVLFAQVAFEGSRQVVYAMCRHRASHFARSGHPGAGGESG